MIVAVFYWAATGTLANATRLRGLFAVIALAFIPWLLIGTGGSMGEGVVTFRPRWYDADAAALAEWRTGNDTKTVERVALPASLSVNDWPEFRGPRRDGVVRGDIALDAEVLKTSERALAASDRRGLVELLRRRTGLLHAGAARRQRVRRFAMTSTTATRYGSMPGRIALTTCSVASDRGRRPLIRTRSSIAFGANGRLACLDATTGNLHWSVDALDGGAPTWGAACSPLVVGDMVVVALSGIGGKLGRLFDRRRFARLARERRRGWLQFRPISPTLSGVRQILILDGEGFSGHAIDDGNRLWFYEWRTEQPKVVQPWVLDDNSVLISMGYGRGMRRLRIERDGDNWSVNEIWASNKLKTKFNDFVCKDGHAYGLDEGIMTCIDLSDGSRRWKGGRYGYGQLLLVGEDILVATEDGRLVLVEATPKEHKELANVAAVEGKTWNHPVIAGGKLLVSQRAGSGMFRLGVILCSNAPGAIGQYRRQIEREKIGLFRRQCRRRHANGRRAVDAEAFRRR